jgi:adenylate/nucleoside-diphosphate kinase
MATKAELDSFLNSPEKYVFGPDLPEFLPQRKSPSYLTFPRQVELQGYCPVTFEEGPPGYLCFCRYTEKFLAKQNISCRFDSIIPGVNTCLVEYENKIYAMASESKLEKFMR